MNFKTAILALFFLFSSCHSNQKPILHLFTWSDYIERAVIERFENEYRCQVVIDTYDSNESMYAKLKLGARGYDLIVPSNYYLDLMREQKMLQPLDPLKLPNAIHLDPTYLTLIGKEALDYGIPYMITMTGLAYRADKIPQFDPTWKIFDHKEFKGRMTMLNDIREAIGAGLKVLGYSVNSTDEKEINEAADVLIRWKKNLAKFESEQYKNGIASAEFLVAQGYSGDVLQVMQENQGVAFSYPKEGTSMTVDFLVIPQDAKEISLAYAFINFLLRPDIAAQNIKFTSYLSPNQDAYPLLDEKLRTNVALFPPDEVLQKTELIKNVHQYSPLFNKAWDRIKASD